MKRILSAALFALFALGSLAPAVAQNVPGAAAINEAWCSTQVGAGVPAGCDPVVGDTAFAYNAGTTTTLTQFIAAPAAGSIRIVAMSFFGVESATGGTAEIEQGTGTNCASNAGVVWAEQLGATGIVQAQVGSGYGQVLILKAGYAACFTVTAGTLVGAGVFGTYAVY
jgi:hypothetical protein